MYTDTFYEQQPKCSFVFYQVQCAHISGDAVNFITVCVEYLHDYSNTKVIQRLAKVIVKYRLLHFIGNVGSSLISLIR